jgi:type 1 fimbriae regulatory protein FimB/type 1 fimbriae regulatory protein FimE
MTNAERRSREYLTEAEVEKRMAPAEKQGRHGYRDASMILIAYRHALRVSELVSLRWEQVDLAQGLVHVNRVKNGTPATHPLRGPELRALRRLQRDYSQSPYVFTGERKGPMPNCEPSFWRINDADNQTIRPGAGGRVGYGNLLMTLLND